MSEDKTEREIEDYLNNGRVTIELVVGDPVTDLGLRTDIKKVEADGSKVSEELAQHLRREYFIDVDKHDFEVFE